MIDEKGLYDKDLSKPPTEKFAIPSNISVGFKPLPELGLETYKGEDGGLYGQGLNTPPADQLAAAQKASEKIEPLDSEGKPSTDGKIVLLSIGMSNTTQEFKTFKSIADKDSEKSPYLVIVDGAQSARDGRSWCKPDTDTWNNVEQKLQRAKVTPQQIQVVWIKHAEMGVAKIGEFPAHAKTLQNSIETTLQIAKKRYPNLKIAYLSNRIYGGYAGKGNKEPYAYESAFAVRWAIKDQMEGKADLNYDTEKGEVKAPVVLWGPYLWADGLTPRKSDGLVWKAEDLRSDDGMHPSELGMKKVAHILLNFFKTDPLAQKWFLKS